MTIWEIVGTKEAIAEQLRLGEELRRKVARADSVHGSDTDDSAGGDKSDDDSDDELDHDTEDGNKVGKKAENKLRNAATEILEGRIYIIHPHK